MSGKEGEKPWTMPEWMEPFREMIAGHGGNGVEDLMNRLRTVPNLAFSNSIVFTMACEVSAQVGLLYRLHEAGIFEEFLHSEKNQEAIETRKLENG